MIRKSPSKKRSLHHCPTCGSSRIHTVFSDYHAHVRGEEVIVPSLERDECPACGEILFSPEAMRRIESYRRQRTSAG